MPVFTFRAATVLERPERTHNSAIKTKWDAFYATLQSGPVFIEGAKVPAIRSAFYARRISSHEGISVRPSGEGFYCEKR
jgi:hypothetical protein